MQDCFRAHPDVYGAELEDDEEAVDTAQADGTETKSKNADEAKPKDVDEAQPPAPLERKHEVLPEPDGVHPLKSKAEKAIGNTEESIRSAAQTAKADTRKIAQKASDKTME
jgi:intermembrane space import and assembly protein 40